MILSCSIALSVQDVSGETVAAKSAGSSEPSEHYLREWLLCGPFPALTNAEQDIESIRLPGMYADLLGGSGGEANAQPVAGQVVTFSGGSCTWTRHLSREDSVDLDSAITKTDRVVAYAYAEVNSSVRQACILAVGSNDGIRAWLNGEPVLDAPGPRASNWTTIWYRLHCVRDAIRFCLKLKSEETDGASPAVFCHSLTKNSSAGCAFLMFRAKKMAHP
jgi:hypothetical protein